MSNFPYHIILSVAHTQENQDDNAYKENELSEPISSRVMELLHDAGITCSLVEEWSDETEPHSRIKKRREVNRIAAVHHKECLAIEIHWNGEHAQSGTCILHDAVSAKSKAIAEKMLPVLLEKLGRGQHYKGIIAFPSAYRDITLEFLRNTKCRAIIIEVDSIKHYADYLGDELQEKTAQGIFEAIKALGHGK